MTKMLIDRAVVEQALEALEESLYATTDKSQFLAFEAITTLRAALAEPVQEPVSKMTAGRAAFFMERFKREEKLLGPNEQAALDFVISMLEGTLAEPQEPVLNPAPGYCKHCKQYTIEEPLPAEPVQEPVAAVAKNATAQFDHAIGADRFKVVRGPFWWHVLIGDGTKKHGKFHSRAGAEQMAADLLREFRNGAFVQHTAPPRHKPLTKEKIVALIHPIVMADMPDEMTDYEIARAVAAAERERCAQIADAYAPVSCDGIAQAIAAEIRSQP